MVPRHNPVKEPEPQHSGSQKKYAHLPLVADELKQDAERRAAPGTGKSAEPGMKGRQGKKGGMFKFLK